MPFFRMRWRVMHKQLILSCLCKPRAAKGEHEVYVLR